MSSLSIRCLQRSSVHDHDTRYASLIDSEPTRTVMAQNCIRHHLVNVLSCTHQWILDKIATHSIHGFTFYVKRYYLNQLSSECHIWQCYACNKWVQSQNECLWLIRPGAGCGGTLAVAGCTVAGSNRIWTSPMQHLWFHTQAVAEAVYIMMYSIKCCR